ncbi:MAG: hypothetical protein ABIN15_06705 [candidate division WOR-3 bacterium]
MIKLFLLFSIILEKEKEKIEEYLNYLWKEDYLSAIELEKGYFNKYKDHPILYSLKTIRYFEYFLDFYEPDSEEEFFKSIEKGILLCDKYKGNDKDIVFLEGVFLAFSAMFEGLRENYLQAITKGFKAYNIIKKFKNYPDSYLALGIYDYGASILQKYVGKTFIKGDRRQKGIEEVKVSILRGVFMKANSYEALIEIFLREKMRDSAFKWAEKFYQEFGESRRTLFTLGSAYRRSGYFEKAEKVYLKLLPMVENQNSNYNKGIVRLYLSECFYVLNKNREEAKKLIKEAEIYLEKSRWYRKDKVLEYLKKLKRQKFFN